jgi:pimeloyl-ACP methyl ester carboxylesterase
MVLGCAVGQAATPARPLNCVDRLKPAERLAGLPAELDGLAYTCLALRSGRHVWVGQAGTEHPRTVLLVHGLGQQAHRDWHAVIPTLARDSHVIALDLPGFGSSESLPQGHDFDALAGAIEQVLAQLAGTRRVQVVGHSLGGAVALHFAHRYPDRLERLVLVDAAGILLKQVFARHLARVALPSVGIAPVDRLLKRLDTRLDGLNRNLIGGLDNRFDFSRWLGQNPGIRNALFGRNTPVDSALGLVEHDFSAAIREVAVPTTVIWGREDGVAPPRTGVLLAARLPDAQLRWIDGAGHVPMKEQPDLFLPLLSEALARTPRPPAATAPPEEAGAASPSNGDVVCRGRSGVAYTGRFERLTLDNCHDIRIHDARLTQLNLVGASATLENVVIDHTGDDGSGGGVALDAQRSQVTATAVQVRGRTAVRSDNSHLDLAGASLRAGEHPLVVTTPSRIYFSVSDIQAPEHAGDVHRVWPAWIVTRPAGSAKD